jgi:two-component system chemotaxis response regulator CheB
MPLKLLVVDDSIIFRSAIKQAVLNDPDIKVIGDCRNGKLAIDFVLNSPPDIITLDVEMPEMDGLQTLQELKSLREAGRIPKIGIIMLSGRTAKGAETTIKALEMGAFDFVAKPQGSSEQESIDLLKRTLLPKIYFYSSMKALKKEPQAELTNVKPIVKPLPNIEGKIRAIFIGVSTGGPKALGELMPKISAITDLPIFIVQHMPEHFTKSLAESLDLKCKHKVKEAEDGEFIANNTIYIAKGGHHMQIKKSCGARPQITLNQQAPENGCRPSVDVLFRSAAAAYGSDCVAIILTGMGRDGTQGLGPLKRAGAYTIAQDEASSIVWGMPGSAVEAGLIDVVLPLDRIPAQLDKILKRT